MGWIDDKFKNVVSGTKDFISSPAGIATLALASPWLMKGATGSSGWLGKASKGEGFLAGILKKAKAKELLTLATKSPLVTNAAKNAALSYGIGTLTGGQHLGKNAAWAAAASVPFSFMKANNMANTFNKGLGKDQQISYLDILTGKTQPGTYADIPGKFQGYKDMASGTGGYDTETFSRMGNTPAPLQEFSMQGKGPGPWNKMGFMEEFPRGASSNRTLDAMNYFGRDGSALTNTLANNTGVSSLIPALGLENIDIMAGGVPQIAALYGGRMSDQEKWDAFMEKEIRKVAFQNGISYEEAKRKIEDGYRPGQFHYKTTPAEDYGPVEIATGGSPAYKDSYIAGGKAVGPGTGKSDSIGPVALSNNEFVFTETASNNFPGGHEGLYSLMNSLDPESETIEEARVQV
tara:strand:+ start:222 stop:1436 length:1215 start_codon:yes stop_codon:yes gene_type:complete